MKSSSSRILQATNYQLQAISIIGFGRMGKAIIHALKQNGFKKILISDGEKNIEVTKKAKIVILAVKPFVISKILQEISTFLRNDQFLISIAAGIPLKSMSEEVALVPPQRDPALGVIRPTSQPKIIRVMPNLPAQAGYGMSVWKSLKKLRAQEKKLVKKILGAFGEEVEVKNENLIDAATAVSGSGPAYVFAFLDALSRTAKRLGFSKETARRIALQTVLGGVKFAEKNTFNFEKLVKQVKTKGGTTEAAFKILEKNHWGKILEKAVIKAYKRARELSKMSFLGKNLYR